METYIIPFQDHYIIYRPLRPLAFIGNRAMAEYAEKCALNGAPQGQKADEFLREIGFFAADREPPAEWAPCEKPLPTIGVLLMTNACNLRCAYCYARAGDEDRCDLSSGLARTAIDAVCGNALTLGKGGFSLTFHGGGEPTLNWSVFEDAVKYARAKPIACEISMSSNGVWDDARTRFIVDNLDSMSLSFDGIQDVQDLQRPLADGCGSFRHVMRSIGALDESDVQYGIRVTTTPESVARLPESIRFLCRNTRCPVIQVEPCYASVRGDYSDPSDEQAGAFVDAYLEAFAVACEAGRTLLYSGARPWVVSASFCRAPEDALVVTPEGDIVTCFETHSRRHPLTTAFTVGRAAPGSIEVDSTAVYRFAEQQRARRLACAGCFCYWHCGGDCASRCTSTPGSNRTRCLVNREITRDLLAWYIAAGNGVWRGV